MSIIKFVLSVLNRKEINDFDERNNFKEVIWNYIYNLQKSENLEIDANKNSYKHKIFYDKLKTLAERYKNVGDEVVPSDKVDDFLILLQSNMRDYLYNDVESELYELRHKHYTKIAWDKSNNAPKTHMQQLKEDMIANLSKKKDYTDLG